jgi:hypothetical protein
LDATYFRTQILPMLVTAGVVREEPSLNDRRNKLIIPNLDEYQNPEKTQKVEVEVDFEDIPF